MLKTNAARMIAETLWGRGDTEAERCNSAAAHWFTCSEHGGMIIDASGLSKDDLKDLSQFIKPQSGYVFSLNGHPVRAGVGQPMVASKDWDHEDVKFFALEKDAAWSVALVILGIGRRSDVTDIMRQVDADRLFKAHFDHMNPEVMVRKALDEATLNKDPDLIVAAVRTSSDQTKVWTADEKSWIVEGYEDAMGPGKSRWLSLCSSAMELDKRGRPAAGMDKREFKELASARRISLFRRAHEAFTSNLRASDAPAVDEGMQPA